MLTTFVGAVAVLFELSFAWPQAVAALRSADVAGVSPVSALLMVVTALGWLLYGVLVADPIIIVANGVMLIATAVILGALVARRRIPVGAGLAVPGSWTVATALAWAALGPEGVAAVAAVVGISMGLPQAARAAVGSTAGVAISSWVLLCGLQAAWLGYGLMVDDRAIVVPNVIALPISVAVVGVLVVRRRGERPAFPDTPTPTLALTPAPAPAPD